MSPTSPRGLSFTIGGLSPRAERPRSEQAAFVVLIAADCSGRHARGVCQPLEGRAPSRVDVDRLEAVMRAWGARVPTPLISASGEACWLEPRSLDDLHPDQLLVSVVPLAELFELRRRLESDVGARARLSDLLGRAEPASAAAASAEPAGPGARAQGPGESADDTLSRLLGGARAEPHAAAAAASTPALTAGGVDLTRLIRTIVGDAAAAQRAAAPPDPALASAADAELGARLRALLGSPALRALEATWRGIDGLCRNCPDEERVRLLVLDASFEELERDVRALPSLLERTGADVLLVDRELDASAADLRACARLLEACRERGVTLLAGARPELGGCTDFAERRDPEESPAPMSADARAAWEALSASRADGALALALPRFLLRQPYGASGEPLEQLAFEELPDPARHEAFCWGNGAYLVARALCVLATDPDGAHPDGGVDVRELPVVHLPGEDGTRVKPCAESCFSERALGRLRAAGFSVLHGWRDTDRVRIYV